jgi:hypothetical protein
VQLSDFTQSLDLTLDRGDIDLKPGKNVPKMEVHTRSGDITSWRCARFAKFDLRASTDRGDASNEYGEPLREEESGRGNIDRGKHRRRARAAARNRPRIHHRAQSQRREDTVPDISIAPSPKSPSSPKPPKPPNPPLKVEHQ